MSSEVTDRLRAMIPDRLRNIAKAIDREASLAARPGQLDRLEELGIAVRQIAHELDGRGHWPRLEDCDD